MTIPQGLGAVIFCVPIDCLDENVLDDSATTKLEQSLLLWKELCTQTWLATTTHVLLFTKSDLLEEKLRAGILVKDWVPDFGDLPNNATEFSKCTFGISLRGSTCISYDFLCRPARPFSSDARQVDACASSASLLSDVRDCKIYSCTWNGIVGSSVGCRTLNPLLLPWMQVRYSRLP